MIKQRPDSRHLGLSTVLGALAALLLLVAAGIFHGRSSARAAPADAPAAGFSYARAMVALGHIAQQPHPIGTAQNEAVRQYLVGALTDLGLSPQVQSTLAVFPAAGSVGQVHNVLARLPGSRPGKALLLAAHYDSVPTGPGAGDDGASVAAVLETVRALKAGPPLENDVIVLFSDGEEVGLLGAQAFVTEHPWARQVGLVLNFEYRGNSGPFWMFETSTGNGKLIDAFGAAVAHPLGSSLLYEVYKVMPNGTDMTVFKQAGMAGMNFAAGERHTSYHTGLDRPELLSPVTLQDEGDIMLALARRFGNADLNRLQGPDSIYFDAPGLGLVRYPVAWVWPCTALAVVLFVLAGVRAARAGMLRVGRAALGSLAYLLALLLLAGASFLLWAAILAVHPGYNLILHGDTYNSVWYLMAFAALTVAGFGLVLSALRRWITSLEMAFGAMLCWLLILAAVSAAMPGVSFLFTWPLIPVLLSLAALTSARARAAGPTARMLIVLAGVAPAVLLFTPLLHLLFFALTPRMVYVMVAVLVLLLGIAAPLISMLTRPYALPLLPLGAGAVLLAIGAATSGFDARHPQPDNVFYFQDGVSGRAFWLSNDTALDPWTRTFFAPDAVRRPVQELYGPPISFRRTPLLLWASAAPPLGLRAPRIEVLEDRSAAGVRTVRARAGSARGADQLQVCVDGVEVDRASVAGRTFTEKPRKYWRVNAYGLAGQALTFEVQVKAGMPFQIRARDVSYGMPPIAHAPRPATMMVQPFLDSDTTQTVQVRAFD